MALGPLTETVEDGAIPSPREKYTAAVRVDPLDNMRLKRLLLSPRQANLPPVGIPRRPPTGTATWAISLLSKPEVHHVRSTTCLIAMHLRRLHRNTKAVPQALRREGSTKALPLSC